MVLNKGAGGRLLRLKKNEPLKFMQKGVNKNILQVGLSPGSTVLKSNLVAFQRA